METEIINPDIKTSQFNISLPIWLTVAILIFYNLAGYGLSLAISIELLKKSEPLLTAASQLLFMLFPAYLFSKQIPLSKKEIFRWDFSINKHFLIYGILILVGFQLFYFGYSYIQKSLIPKDLQQFYTGLEQMIQKMYLQILGGSGLMTLIRSTIVGAMIPAFTEELLFRGFLQRSLQIEMKLPKAAFISGVIFSFAHFNPIDFVGLLLLGFLLGMLAGYSGSILPVILLHFCNNFIAVLSIYFNSDILNTKSYTMLEGFPQAILFAFSGGLLIFLSLNRMKKIN